MTERPRTPAGDAYRRPHVLIVTDDTGLSGFLNEGLIVAGCWTSVIASGVQVLEVFRLRTFELVLVDVALRGLGAAELLRRLRSFDEATGQPRTDIPIIIVAEREDEVAAAGVDSGHVDGSVVAPIEIEELALTIYATVRAWRESHPDRPWSDEVAQRPADA